VLEKNKGYKSILSGDQENLKGLSEILKLNVLVYFKYTPITSVVIKRSFSVYKNMLTIDRPAF
jgi:cell shape-determining protein MreC